MANPMSELLKYAISQPMAKTCYLCTTCEIASWHCVSSKYQVLFQNEQVSNIAKCGRISGALPYGCC